VDLGQAYRKAQVKEIDRLDVGDQKTTQVGDWFYLKILVNMPAPLHAEFTPESFLDQVSARFVCVNTTNQCPNGPRRKM
jgi:hypothetical protein